MIANPACGIAQQTWTLEECIDYAVEHNLKVEDYNLVAANRQEIYKQSYREFLPDVGANTGYNIRYGRSVDPNTNVITSTDFFSNNYSVNASLEIFRGFQRSNAIEASRFLLNAAKQDIRREKYLLAFRVMTAWYDVLFYHEQRQITRQQVHTSQAQYDLVQRQIELGLKAGTDLLEAEAVLVADQLAVTQSDHNLGAARLALIQEMNLEDGIELQIDTMHMKMESEYFTIKPDADSIYRTALAFLPEIQAGQARLQAAETEMAITRGTLYPSFRISGGYGTGYFETRLDQSGEIIPFGLQLRDNASYYIGVSMNIPILDRWRVRSGINRQKITLRQTVNQLNIQKQELEKLIRQLIQDVEAGQAEFIQSRQSEAAGKLAFEVAQKKYEKGLISILDLNQSKTLYAMAQNQNLQIRLKLLVLKKTLDFYRGVPLFDMD